MVPRPVGSPYGTILPLRRQSAGAPRALARENCVRGQAG